MKIDDARVTEHAFTAARTAIDTKRANDIRLLRNWNNGGCLALGSQKPDVTELSPEEDRLIRALWDTLPGSSCWMTALLMLCEEPEADDEYVTVDFRKARVVRSLVSQKWTFAKHVFYLGRWYYNGLDVIYPRRELAEKEMHRWLNRREGAGASTDDS